MAEPPPKQPRLEEAEEARGLPTTNEAENVDYSDIVKSDTFVDKTILVRKFQKPLRTGLKKFLVTAPHGYRKSVNLSMLKKFFEIEVDLEGNPKTSMRFDYGTRTWLENNDQTESFKFFKENNFKLWTCNCKTTHTIAEKTTGKCLCTRIIYRHCGQYPIVSMKFKKLNSETKDDLMSSCKSLLDNLFDQYAYLGTSKNLRQEEREAFLNSIPGSNLDQQKVCHSLKNLVKCINKHFCRRVFVLIDDFDSPIIQLINSSNTASIGYLTHIKEVIQLVEMMASCLMVANKDVSGGLITSSLSTFFPPYFSSNMEICPFLENRQIALLFGFTVRDVDSLLERPQFKDFNERYILDHYNGYMALKKSAKMYCSFSVVSYLRKWQEDHRSCVEYLSDNSWVRTYGIPMLNRVFLIPEIRDKIKTALSHDSCVIDNSCKNLRAKDILQIKSIVNEHVMFPIDVKEDAFILYLKDSGYFNLYQLDIWSYKMEILNREIRDEVARNFYDPEYYQQEYKYTSKQIVDYCNALLCLDPNRPETFKKLADSIEQMYSEDVPMPRNREEFKAPLVAFALGMQDVVVKADLCCQSRLDLLMCRENDSSGIIIEFKWGSNENSENGLIQIFDHQCYKAFDFFNVQSVK